MYQPASDKISPGRIDNPIVSGMNSFRTQHVEEVGFDKYEYKVKNASGASRVLGDVVIWKAVTGIDEINVTTTYGDSKVLGMVTGPIINNGYGTVLTHGFTKSLKCNGTTDIAGGDYLTVFSSGNVAAKAR